MVKAIFVKRSITAKILRNPLIRIGIFPGSQHFVGWIPILADRRASTITAGGVQGSGGRVGGGGVKTRLPARRFVGVGTAERYEFCGSRCTGHRVASGEIFSAEWRGTAREGTVETGGIDCDATLGTCPIHDRRSTYLPTTYTLRQARLFLAYPALLSICATKRPLRGLTAPPDRLQNLSTLETTPSTSQPSIIESRESRRCHEITCPWV